MKYSSGVDPLLNHPIQRYAESLTLKTQYLSIYIIIIIIIIISNSIVCLEAVFLKLTSSKYK